MKARMARMVPVLLLAGLAVGCNKPKDEPVAQAPEQEPLPVFPESTVPAPEAQPGDGVAAVPTGSEPAQSYLGQGASDTPVDTTAATASQSPSVSRAQEPKQRYAPAVTKTTRTYEVRKGDTLQKISKRFYGTTTKWRLLYTTNRAILPKGPDQLPVGTKLAIP